jgi:pimeloyl-ACP methyl ester carboxylesterase
MHGFARVRNKERSMTAQRVSLVTSLPWFGDLRALISAPRSDASRAVIVAQRRELSDERLGQLSYFTNAGERGTRREPALLLVHAPSLGTSAHDLRRLFEDFRDERALFAPDLPGFGHSVCPAEPPSAELYMEAIERMVDVAAAQVEGSVDLVATGLSAEFAAKVAAQRPEVVRSLTLLNPTGFASGRERSAIEDAARRGKTLWSLALLRRLGLGSLLVDALTTRASLRRQRPLRGLPQAASALCRDLAGARRPDAMRAGLAYLAGALYPRENPLAIYTRVHCPTLIVTTQDAAARFDELPRFVKWRDHFSALELPRLDLTAEHDSANVAEAMRAFWDGPGRRSRVC